MYYQLQLNVLSVAKAKKTGGKRQHTGEMQIECYQLQKEERKAHCRKAAASEKKKGINHTGEKHNREKLIECYQLQVAKRR